MTKRKTQQANMCDCSISTDAKLAKAGFKQKLLSPTQKVLNF